jgi:mono/diheme cytochrome c family protein
MDLGEFRRSLLSAGYAALLLVVVPVVAAQAADANLGTVDIQSPPIPKDQAKTLKNPIPFTKESIARGQSTFLRNCVGCHGKDGKAQAAEVANATDLTSPPFWKNGTQEGEIFRSIRDGAGMGMPPFRAQIHQEQDLWDLVNFIRNLWPAPMRPTEQ